MRTQDSSQENLHEGYGPPGASFHAAGRRTLENSTPRSEESSSQFFNPHPITKPRMNNFTQINSELLAADARGRKHIPVAVFAVIMIHVVLFVFLLIAAGCRASTRAKANLPADNVEEMAQQTLNAPTAREAAPVPPAKLAAYSGSAPFSNEPVVATEPVVEPETPSTLAAIEQSAARPANSHRMRPPPVPAIRKRTTSANAAVYVVQAGDTVGEIAKRHGTTVQAIKTANNLKNHLIHPGQKLRVKPEHTENGAGAAPLVKTSKPKRSNEV